MEYLSHWVHDTVANPTTISHGKLGLISLISCLLLLDTRVLNTFLVNAIVVVLYTLMNWNRLSPLRAFLHFLRQWHLNLTMASVVLP